LSGRDPEDPRFVDLGQPLHREVFYRDSGISGLTQLVYHDEGNLLDGEPDPDAHYREKILPHKLALDAAYLRTAQRASTCGYSLRRRWCFWVARSVFRPTFGQRLRNRPMPNFVLRGRHLFVYDVIVTAVTIVLAFILRFDRASFALSLSNAMPAGLVPLIVMPASSSPLACTGESGDTPRSRRCIWSYSPWGLEPRSESWPSWPWRPFGSRARPASRVRSSRSKHSSRRPSWREALRGPRKPQKRRGLSGSAARSWISFPRSSTAPARPESRWPGSPCAIRLPA